MTDHGVRKGPFVTRVVEAQPILVEGRELVPLVRVTSRVQRRASLRSDRVRGQGFAFVDLRPVAVLDRGGNGQLIQRRHEVRNETTRVMSRLALAVFLIPCLAKLLIYLSRRLDHESRNPPSA